MSEMIDVVIRYLYLTPCNTRGTPCHSHYTFYEELLTFYPKTNNCDYLLINKLINTLLKLFIMRALPRTTLRGYYKTLIFRRK